MTGRSVGQGEGFVAAHKVVIGQFSAVSGVNTVDFVEYLQESVGRVRKCLRSLALLFSCPQHFSFHLTAQLESGA